MSSQPLRVDSLRLAIQRPHAGPNTWIAIEMGERIFAGALLLFTLPLLVVIASITVVLSRQSPLIAHRRLGKEGRSVWVLKFRTMWDGRGRRRWGFIEWLPQTEFARAAPKSIDDPRVTSRFAAVCRRYSIDELPQLWQVFRGEMALVGPRPLTRSELDDHYGADAAELLRRKPGLTGLWQVKGRSRLTYDQRRRLDLFMIRRWSLPLYTRILIATVPCVVAGKDAW